jgi:methanethiol S-methyltransferase
MTFSPKDFFAALLWILWCALHSTLITTTVTDYLKRRLGERFRFYRLFYNSVSSVTLIPILYYSISIREAPVFRWEGPLAVVKYLLLLTSAYLFVAGARHYSLSQLFGIHQIKTGRVNRTLSGDDTLDTSGILGVIRHPWYAAGILIVCPQDISPSTLLINIVISTYFVIGAFLEERKLLEKFGQRYREYQKNVSMFVPYKWLKAKITGMR